MIQTLLIATTLSHLSLSLEIAQQIQPTSNAEMRLVEIRDLIKTGEYLKAEQLLNENASKFNSYSEFHFLYGRVMQESKRNTNALVSYSIAFFLDKKNARALVNKALVRGALGDLQGALKDLDEASILAPQEPAIYMNRGVTYAGLGKPKQAISEFSAAIKINSRYADAFRNRGITLFYQKDLSGACRDWKQAAKLGDSETLRWANQYCPPNRQKATASTRRGG